MTTHEPNCPACRVAMERGYLLDLGDHNSRKPAAWVAGPPEKSFWTGLRTKDRAVMPIVSFRCPRCGMLANFATSAGEAGSA